MKGMDTVYFDFVIEVIFPVTKKIFCLMMFLTEKSLLNCGRTDKHEVGVIAVKYSITNFGLSRFGFPIVHVDS